MPARLSISMKITDSAIPSVEELEAECHRECCDAADQKPSVAPPNQYQQLGEDLCQRLLVDLETGDATLRGETLESFHAFCSQCGISIDGL